MKVVSNIEISLHVFHPLHELIKILNHTYLFQNQSATNQMIVMEKEHALSTQYDAMQDNLQTVNFMICFPQLYERKKENLDVATSVDYGVASSKMGWTLRWKPK